MKYTMLSEELKSLRNRNNEEIFYEEVATGNVAYRAPRGEDGKVLHTTSGMTADEKKGHYVYRDGLLRYETMEDFREGRKEKHQTTTARSTSNAASPKPVSAKNLDSTLEKIQQTLAGIAANAEPTSAVAPFASLSRYNEAKAVLPPEVKDVIEENLKEYTSTTLGQVKDFFNQIIAAAQECLTKVEVIEKELKSNITKRI